MMSWHLDFRSHDGSIVCGRVIMTTQAADRGCQRGCHDGLPVTSTYKRYGAQVAVCLRRQGDVPSLLLLMKGNDCFLEWIRMSIQNALCGFKEAQYCQLLVYIQAVQGSSGLIMIVQVEIGGGHVGQEWIATWGKSLHQYGDSIRVNKASSSWKPLGPEALLGGPMFQSYDAHALNYDPSQTYNLGKLTRSLLKGFS